MKIPWFFLKNARKPSGFWGKIFIAHMNSGHAGLTAWSLELLAIEKADAVLDIGCGGGKAVSILEKNKNIKKVYGIDYSDTSVRCAVKRNKKAVEIGRVEITKGTVSNLPYCDDSIDYAMSFESYYYWPDLERDMKEILRVVKPGGKFMLVAEMYKNDSNTETQKQFVKDLDMRNLTIDEFRDVFSLAGFIDIVLTCQNEKGWINIIGTKPQ